jgi:NADH dehydrogenase FAD-containing subunit
MVVVGGGPTGVELSGELHDFLEEDLKSWYPELAGKVRITLVEALPSVLPMFSKQLIDYTQSTFKKSKIDILTKTMVKEVKEKSVILQMPDKSIQEIPCGLVVWAGVCSSFHYFLFKLCLPCCRATRGAKLQETSWLGSPQSKRTHAVLSLTV